MKHNRWLQDNFILTEWGTEDEHRGGLFTMMEREVGVSNSDLVGMSKRNLGREHSCPKVIMLNFCCVIRDVNSFPIKFSVKMFLFNECDIWSLYEGGDSAKVWVWPQVGDRMRRGQASSIFLGCRKNAATQVFLVLLLSLMRTPEEK